MAKQDSEKPSFSLQSYIEQTAKLLREAIRPLTKRRNYSLDSAPSISNRVEQIAKMLRKAAKKSKKK